MYENGSEVLWNVFREVCNKIKSVVNKVRRLFLFKVLFLKCLKEVWKVIYCIFNFFFKLLRENLDELNRYFVLIVICIMGLEFDDFIGLLDFLYLLLEYLIGFIFRKVMFEEVFKEINCLCFDSFIGYD